MDIKKLKTSTGISGLDEMLEGGFPKKRIILVRGGPGSGKTTMCMQFIIEGVKNNESGIYVSMEEPIDLVRENMQLFDWDIKEKEEKGLLHLIDASEILSKGPISQQRNYQQKLIMTGLTDILKRTITHFNAKRLAIDPITSAVIQQRFPTDKRFEILELIKTLRIMNCTSLISSEFSSSDGGDFYVEEYLADGVVILSKILKNYKIIKTARIEKMRGVKHDDDPHRYEITNRGIVVYNTEPVIT